ncbi:MAG: ATP-binding cassette domain-containing protein [Chloroflexi bacterium]|nr:ATP-binding cassette domain-containing protein [Chloroflexota bacterium]
MPTIIDVSVLHKHYKHIKALDGLSLTVEEGEILGVLGPNGAGKTTLIKCLLTLISPTSGSIRVAGIDAARSSDKVRQVCGYVPQEVSVDGELTGYENLLLYSKLYFIPRSEREKRIEDILDYMELTPRAHDLAKTYSGGMMRRLELAQAMVNRPRILFLDEPTLGLDPAAKRMVWKHILQLRQEFGTTVFLTTHDMAEADALCDRIAMISKGKIAAFNTVAYLKDSVGGDIISLVTANGSPAGLLTTLGFTPLGPQDNSYELVHRDGEKSIPSILEALSAGGTKVESVSLKKPTLDDVFLKYAGARLDQEQTWDESWRLRRAVRKRH